MTNLESFIRDIPDFPKPGIMFKDITPLLGDPTAFRACVERMAADLQGVPCDAIVGIEARGFIFGAAMSLAMDVGFVPVRKPGKLPSETVSQEYALEYGTDTIEMHKDAVAKGASVVIVDDLIATGGTAAAACQLIEGQGAVVSALSFAIALDFIPWKDKLGDRDVRALLRYS